jgi:hypothetical protein
MLAIAVACASKPDVDKIAIGQPVEITKADGGVVEGKLTAKDAQTVKVDTDQSTREIPRASIADVQVIDPKTPVTLPEVAKFHEHTIPEGAALAVRLTAPVSSATNHAEDPVEGELADPVRVDGVTVLPAGSVVRGQVVAAQSSGKVKGLASLSLVFQSVTASGSSERYAIAADWSREAQPTKTEDAKKIGIGAGAGAVLGAIIGGGKGAAIGTAAGGGAGTAAVLATSGKEVTLGRGDIVKVTLAKPVDVRLPIEKNK